MKSSVSNFAKTATPKPLIPSTYLSENLVLNIKILGKNPQKIATVYCQV